MIIAAIVVVCILLLVAGFLLPRLSRYPQRGVDRRRGGRASPDQPHAPMPRGASARALTDCSSTTARQP